MEMKLKLSDVLNINHTLKSIVDNTALKVDPVFKFKLLGILKNLENHVTSFEIIRNEKIAEYGKKTDDGKIYIPEDDEDALKKINKDLSSIVETTVSVNIEKLKVSEVFTQGLFSEHLVALYSIIEE